MFTRLTRFKYHRFEIIPTYVKLKTDQINLRGKELFKLVEKTIIAQVNSIINRLQQRSELQLLSPKQVWDADIDKELARIDWKDRSTDPAIIALMAGLYLWNDNLYTSHSYCQQIEDDPTGAYWHAIMHRMEPDYPNSKYWFRRAGNHPVKQELSIEAAQYLQQHAPLESLPAGAFQTVLKRFRDEQDWNSADFVDIVQAQEYGQGTSQTKEILQHLQRIEIQLLFAYTYQQAFNEKLI